MVKKGCTPLFFWKNSCRFISIVCYLFFLSVHISLPDGRMWRGSVLPTFILWQFWTKLGLKSKAKFNLKQTITKHAKWNVGRIAQKRRGTVHSVRFINNNAVIIRHQQSTFVISHDAAASVGSDWAIIREVHFHYRVPLIYLSVYNTLWYLTLIGQFSIDRMYTYGC